MRVGGEMGEGVGGWGEGVYLRPQILSPSKKDINEKK